MERTSLYLAPLLLVFINLHSQTAFSQIYATPKGNGYTGDGSCSNPDKPCNLIAAGEDATDLGVNGNTIFALLPERGGLSDLCRGFCGQR